MHTGRRGADDRLGVPNLRTKETCVLDMLVSVRGRLDGTNVRCLPAEFFVQGRSANYLSVFHFRDHVVGYLIRFLSHLSRLLTLVQQCALAYSYPCRKGAQGGNHGLLSPIYHRISVMIL